jgi:valyl-tRNA synthetase
MLEKNLDFAKTQEKLVKKWHELKVNEFNARSSKPFYVIDCPPPFPTGEFHMGNVLNWCYIDFAARFKRMSGFEVLFPQGWDCHGFPTEVKVEAKYGKGLSRDEFREKCVQWTQDMIATIKPQMNSLGLSIDWNHEYYTTAESYKKLVQLSLLKMFEQQLVYREKHPVLWCPCCGSAIAKAETDEVERETLLNTIVFKTQSGEKPLLIATTRPELLHACVALLVHPTDERYKESHGSRAIVPLFNKTIPVIADADVDKDFGTGIVMVCTFGDKQDVVWAYRHKLQVIDAIDEKGLLKNAGAYEGLHLNKARTKILEDLQTRGLLVKQEKLKQVVKIHDRCKKPVELVLSTQWFIKIRGSEEEILRLARSMTWTPPHALQLFEDWVNGLEWDWCISRQRVFGIPIPFWYCDSCGKVYAPKEKDLPVDPAAEAFEKKECSCGGKIVGETSICDGWVDSSVTPLVVAGWPKESFSKMYPSALRPQGTDIIRTWAFYTIFRCLKLTGEAPFKDLVINGMVQGEDGKKMSKSLGNYVEAKDAIVRYGSDALRQWAALSGSTGKDNQFRWKDVAYAHSFITKLWNASKFVEKASEDFDSKDVELRVIDRWMESRLHATIRTCSVALKNYDFYSAITALHSFFWHDFCDNYLEDVKYRIYGDDKKSKQASQFVCRSVLENTLLLLAPFAPFASEEIYSRLFAKKNESIHNCSWPSFDEAKIDMQIERKGELLHNALSEVRKFKAVHNLPLNAELKIVEINASEADLKEFTDVQEELKNVAKAKAIDFVSAAEFGVKCTA